MAFIELQIYLLIKEMLSGAVYKQVLRLSSVVKSVRSKHTLPDLP